MNNGKHGQGTHNNKMGADSLVENTPITQMSQKVQAQNVCPSQIVQDFCFEIFFFSLVKINRHGNENIRNLFKKTKKQKIQTF